MALGTPTSLDFVSLDNFFDSVTYTSDPSPGSKLVMTDSDFVIAVLLLKIDIKLEMLRARR